MNNGRIVFQRLNQIRHKGITKQGCHRALGLEITGMNRFARAGIPHNDVAQAALQV